MTYLFTSPDNIPYPEPGTKIADTSSSENLTNLLKQQATVVQTALSGRDSVTPKIRGSVDGMNLNNLIGPEWFGWHTLTSTGGATPLPSGLNNRAELFIHGYDIYNTVQVLTGRESNVSWQRTCLEPTATPKVWTPWRSSVGANGSCNGRDLNEMFRLVDFGTWDFDYTSSTLNMPPGLVGKGILTVRGSGQYTVVQEVTSREQNITWTRTGTNLGTTPPRWSDWAVTGVPEVSSRVEMGLVGDSLVASHNLVPSLTAALPGIYCYSRGWNGETTDGLTLRLGARDIYWTVDGGSIPATGSVTVTTAQKIELTASDTFYTGLLAGVPGRISKVGSTYSFIRDTDGTAVTVSAPTQLVPTWLQSSKMHMIGILAGRNDVSLNAQGVEGSIPAHVVANVRRIIEWMTPRKKLFFLMGTINKMSEPVGSAGYEAVVEINKRLGDLYPGQFVGIRDYLINQAIYDLGITPTSADLANIANDCPPSSVMVDDTHYTDQAATAIVNNLIVPWLKGNGYVAV